MNKEEQIKYLEEELERTVKLYLINEVTYRSLSSKIMSVSKPNNKLLGIQTDTKQKKEFFEKQVRSFRGLINEIKKGAFEV